LQAIHAWSTGDGRVENVSKFLVDLAVEAEEAGWDGFFLWDHLWFNWQPIPMADPWTVLSAAAARTSRIKLGTNVTPLTRRRPQVLAKQLVSLDQISDGRVILGAGLGSKAARPEDFASFGEETSYATLNEMFDEALEIITGLWSGEQFTYRGRHHTVEGVTFQPVPVQRPRIPIWIGGGGGRTLRRVARYDGWVTGGDNPSAGETGLTIEEMGRKIETIRGYRKVDTPLDVAYEFEFPGDGREMEVLVSEAEEVGITWFLDGIFGLRFDGIKALEYVREGPPEV